MTSPKPTNESAPLLDTDEPDDIVRPEPEGPRRRDVASQESGSTEGLIRFVVGPDGFVVPDLAQKLPGRGLWVKADRDSLELAVRRNLFSRAAKKAVRTPDGLVATVHTLLRRRVLDLLGLARREGVLLTGFEKVLSTLKSGEAAWLIEASDGAADGRGRMLSAIRHGDGRIGVCGLFGNAELSVALGLENVIHAALMKGRRQARFAQELARLSGFEPLCPEAWGVSGHPD